MNLFRCLSISHLIQLYATVLQTVNIIVLVVVFIKCYLILEIKQK